MSSCPVWTTKSSSGSMTDEEFDDALDDVGPYDRAKILWHLNGKERVVERPNYAKIGCAYMLAMLWGIPWAILGLACIISVVAWPLGVLFLAIGSYPLYRAVKKWSEIEDA